MRPAPGVEPRGSVRCGSASRHLYARAQRMAGKSDSLPIVKLHRLLEQVAVSPPATARRGRLSARTRRGSGHAVVFRRGPSSHLSITSKCSKCAAESVAGLFWISYQHSPDTVR